MTTTRRAEDPRGGTRRSPIATAVRWVTSLALAVAVVGVLVLSVGTFTGWLSVQTVPTGSMEPAIRKGSAIVVDPVPVGDIAVGDVIVFAAPTTGTMTVHRVVDIEQGESGPIFTTKGDANGGPDPWRLSVAGDHLHRVRMAVPVLGKVLLALSAPTTRLALAGLGAVLVLGFGLSHLWRRPARTSEAHGTWDAALDRVTDSLPHPTLPHPDEVTVENPPEGDRDGEADSVADAVEAARPRALDPLVALLAATSADDSNLDADAAPATGPGPTTAGPHPRVRRLTTVGSTSLVAAVLVAGAIAWLPARTANASFIATSAAAESISTLTVPAKTSVACSWSTTTAVTLSWSNPNTTDSTQVLVANTSGGTTSVGASAPAAATSVSYAPTAPLTTVRYLSTRAVAGTWTSVASPEIPTNLCRYSVRLTAGAGTAAFAGDGGAATAASLNAPYQTADAPDGRIFVADSANNRIRVISTAGVISTFAGGPAASACSYAGPVATLGLTAPRGVAVDSAGNVFIADTGAACIRKVDTAGNVTRVAGGGATTTCTALTSTTVSLSSPSGLAIDSTGAVIVADTGRNCIRKIVGTTVSAVAGGGATTTCTALTATTVSLSGPIGVAVDSSNNVYIADTGRNCIRKIVGTTVSVAAGGGATTACTATTTSTGVSLSAPQGVAVDSAGTVYVADTGRRCVRKVVTTTVTQVGFTGVTGSTGDNGPALAATISIPGMVEVLAGGDLLVSDRAATAGSSDVRRIAMS